MDISYATYQLNPLSQLNSAHVAQEPQLGILLRIKKNKWVGHSVLHPWPELGDAKLEDDIKLLEQQNPSFLARVALSQARRDGDYRIEKKPLILGEPLLKNNFLVAHVDELSKIQLEKNKKLGFEVIKMKAGVDLDKELFYAKRILDTGNFGLRFDFNSSLEWANFQKFFEALPTKYIEYAEDPFTYSEEVWTEAQKLLPLALDFEAKKISWEKHQPPIAKVLIVKPLRMNMEVVISCLEAWKMDFTVTSAMDHPLGVVQAYSWAQELSVQFPKQCRAPGCLTLDVYESTPYHQEISVQGPWLKSTRTPHASFEKLLIGESWTPLS